MTRGGREGGGGGGGTDIKLDKTAKNRFPFIPKCGIQFVISDQLFLDDIAYEN